MPTLEELQKLKNKPEEIHRNPFEKFPNAIIFLIAGVSGVGKSTVVQKIVKTSIRGKNIVFIVTYTTRDKRNNPQTGREIDGVNYYFISAEEFVQLKEMDFFAEWEEVYTGCFYGTSYNELYEAASKYGYGITDIDVHGARALKALFPKNIHTIFLQPQSLEQATQQLRVRSEQEGVSEKKIVERLKRFELEMEQSKHFDSLVTSVAGDPDHAINCVRQIILGKIRASFE